MELDYREITDMTAVRSLLPMLKRNLRLTGDDQDAVLVEKLLAALADSGHYIGGPCVATDMVATGTIPSSGIQTVVLRGPVLSLASVVLGGEDVTENCTMDGNSLSLPSADAGTALTVTYRAGWCPIPPDMAAAVILRASSLYSNPLDSVETLTKASSNLLRHYRWRQ